MDTHKTPPKQENALLNIGLNFALPVFIMSKGPNSTWITGLAESLNLKPGIAAMMLALLLFPIGYGIYDFVVRRKYNFFYPWIRQRTHDGPMTVMEVDKELIAWKEAAIPSLLGLAVLASLKTRNPLVKLFYLQRSGYAGGESKHSP